MWEWVYEAAIKLCKHVNRLRWLIYWLIDVIIIIIIIIIIINLLDF